MSSSNPCSNSSLNSNPPTSSSSGGVVSINQQGGSSNNGHSIGQAPSQNQQQSSQESQHQSRSSMSNTLANSAGAALAASGAGSSVTSAGGASTESISSIRPYVPSNSLRFALLNAGQPSSRSSSSLLGSFNLHLLNLRNPLSAQLLREGRIERSARVVSGFSASQPTTRNSSYQNNSAAQITPSTNINRPLSSLSLTQQINQFLSQPSPSTTTAQSNQQQQLLQQHHHLNQQQQLQQQPQQQQQQQPSLDQFQGSNEDYIFGTESLATPSENVELVKCAICMHIYQNPIACGNCLNHFCSQCIREWLNRNPRSCPLCKNFREMRCVPMLKNMLDKLQFICSNKSHGCEEVIRYEQVLKHEESCDYRQQICPILGCGEQMIKKLIEKHVSEECDYVLASCQWCKVQIKKKSLTEHEDTCDQKEVTCELCSEIFHFKEIQSHDSKCPQKIIPCSWCSKEVKQCELSDHEDCCSERIVRCQGCFYECCLNDHFLHTKSCQEISVFCHRCQTEMRRREFSSHSLEQCIENIHKVNSMKIFQLENENKELKKKLSQNSVDNKQELSRMNSLISLISNHISWGRPRNHSNRFSPDYKDQDIFVTACGATALVRDCKKKRRDRFVILDHPTRLLDQKESITFQIKSRRSEWYAIGICDETNVYSSRRYHDIGHLSYLTSANGILYSSHNPNENWKNTSFKIDQDNIITVNFIVIKPSNSQLQQQLSQPLSQQSSSNSSLVPSAAIDQLANIPALQFIERNRNPMPTAAVLQLQMQLQFINHSKNQELIITLDPAQIHGGKFYFCACLRCPGDSIEIVPNPVENIQQNSAAAEQVAIDNSQQMEQEINSQLSQSQPQLQSQQTASNSQSLSLQQQQQQQQQQLLQQQQSEVELGNDGNNTFENQTVDPSWLQSRMINNQQRATSNQNSGGFALNGFRDMEESDLNSDEDF